MADTVSRRTGKAKRLKSKVGSEGCQLSTAGPLKNIKIVGREVFENCVYRYFDGSAVLMIQLHQK